MENMEKIKGRARVVYFCPVSFSFKSKGLSSFCHRNGGGMPHEYGHAA